MHLKSVSLYLNFLKTLLDFGPERQVLQKSLEFILNHMRREEFNPALLWVPMFRDQRTLRDDIPIVVCQKVEVSARPRYFLSV